MNETPKTDTISQRGPSVADLEERLRRRPGAAIFRYQIAVYKCGLKGPVTESDRISIGEGILRSIIPPSFAIGMFINEYKSLRRSGLVPEERTDPA